MKAPRENDIVIVLEDDNEYEAIVHTVLAIQFMVRDTKGRDVFLLNKYEGNDWRHKT